MTHAINAPLKIALRHELESLLGQRQSAAEISYVYVTMLNVRRARLVRRGRLRVNWWCYRRSRCAIATLRRWCDETRSRQRMKVIYQIIQTNGWQKSSDCEDLSKKTRSALRQPTSGRRTEPRHQRGLSADDTMTGILQYNFIRKTVTRGAKPALLNKQPWQMVGIQT